MSSPGNARLVHVGAPCRRVDRVDAQVGVLDREHRGQLVQRGLAGAVAAPARVGLDRGVGADVDTVPRAAAARGAGLDEGERGEHVDVVHGARGRAARRSASGGSGLGPSSLALFTSRSSRRADGRGQRGAVPRVGDVARDGGDAVGTGEAGYGGGERRGVAAVDDERPAAVGEAVARARPRPREAPVMSAVRVSMGLPS